jgi:hypothetical protein
MLQNIYCYQFPTVDDVKKIGGDTGLDRVRRYSLIHLLRGKGDDMLNCEASDFGSPQEFVLAMDWMKLTGYKNPALYRRADEYRFQNKLLSLSDYSHAYLDGMKRKQETNTYGNVVETLYLDKYTSDVINGSILLNSYIELGILLCGVRGGGGGGRGVAGVGGGFWGGWAGGGGAGGGGGGGGRREGGGGGAGGGAGGRGGGGGGGGRGRVWGAGGGGGGGGGGGWGLWRGGGGGWGRGGRVWGGGGGEGGRGGHWHSPGWDGVGGAEGVDFKRLQGAPGFRTIGGGSVWGVKTPSYYIPLVSLFRVLWGV